MSSLSERANGACELCGSSLNLIAVAVDTDAAQTPDTSALLCAECRPGLEPGAVLEGPHWRCLQDSIWSVVPAIQVLSYRLLHRTKSLPWAMDLLDQVYLEDDVRAWAERGLQEASESNLAVVDSNGTELQDGDSVTLIKDLDVKGAGFTAKRGTLVKNIRLGDDPSHIEGKVNKVSVMLKTCFLKRST